MPPNPARSRNPTPHATRFRTGRERLIARVARPAAGNRAVMARPDRPQPADERPLRVPAADRERDVVAAASQRFAQVLGGPVRVAGRRPAQIRARRRAGEAREAFLPGDQLETGQRPDALAAVPAVVDRAPRGIDAPPVRIRADAK